MNQTVSNHAGETLILRKEENENNQYHAIGIKVGYYSQRFNEVYDDYKSWDFTPEEVEAGIFRIEVYGTNDCTNKYIDPIYIESDPERDILWIQMLQLEANGGAEAPHMPPIREQWYQEYSYDDFDLITTFLHHQMVFKIFTENYDFENNYFDFMDFCIDIYNAEDLPIDAEIELVDASADTDRGMQYAYEPVGGYLYLNV